MFPAPKITTILQISASEVIFYRVFLLSYKITHIKRDENFNMIIFTKAIPIESIRHCDLL